MSKSLFYSFILNIVSQPWAAGYGDAYRDGTLGFTVMYWGTDYNDPNVQLEFLPGANVGLRAGWTAEMDPELAALYQDAMKATDNDARIAVLEQIQDDIFLYVEKKKNPEIRNQFQTMLASPEYQKLLRSYICPVSYTHLTLPTNREV